MTPLIQTPITHRFIPTNGIQLHVAQAGDPANPLIILLHGFPEFWYGWRNQIDALVEAGYHVWCPDQRGYNLSDKPHGIPAYQLHTLGADIVGLIDASGREKVYLVGHDWGAAIAWYVAIYHPERLHKLAILNVPHPQVSGRALRGGDLAQMLKSWYFGAFQIPFLPETLFTLGDANLAASMLFASSNPGTFTDSALREYVKAWKQPGAATGMINWYRAIVQHQPDLSGDLRVHVPTHIIWGVNDVALNVNLAEESRQQCIEGELTLIDDATHWVQHDAAEQVNAILLSHFGCMG
jgi:pimeloyl-ACP methyl ester carboxylesterase